MAFQKKVSSKIVHVQGKRGPNEVPVFLCMQLPAKLLVKRRTLFTAQELAKEIGVSRNTIGKLERDPLSVKGATLRKYLLLLGWRLRFAKNFRGVVDTQ